MLLLLLIIIAVIALPALAYTEYLRWRAAFTWSSRRSTTRTTIPLSLRTTQSVCRTSLMSVVRTELTTHGGLQ